MKLKMSLPERPGWIFVIPGFDFVALLLALVMLTGVVAKESYVEIKLPPSDLRGTPLGDQNPVVVMLKSTSAGPIFYVEGVKVAQADLAQVVSESANKRETKSVALKIDSEASVGERQTLINALKNLKSIRLIDTYRLESRPAEGL